MANLRSGERTVTELADPFDMTGPAITKHLKVLERAGLIERSRDAQRRPCRLRADPFKEIQNLLHAYQPFWDQSFEKLDSLLASEASRVER